MHSIKTFQFGTNKLFGSLPKEFGSLPSLVNLDISFNRLTGTLPTFASPTIRLIDLGHNDFHGSIPSIIASTKDSILQRLVLSQNRLSGSIPDTISAYSNLNMLDLSNNNLHGEIPESIGKLHLLQHLHLNNNFLIGPIPSTLAISHPESGRIADLLEEIHLHDNALSGTVPVQLADLPKLRELLIYENKLTGDIPSDICSPNVNTHFFQHLDANDPNIDYCDAISCPADSVAKDGVYPCVRCKNSHYNPYIGQMRSCNTYTNQRSILKKFYDTTSIDGKWTEDDGDNWSKDDTFICDFTGVTCDENYNVIAIELSNRGLKGTIPDEIGFLPYLEKIDLSDNNLSGFLPSDFRWAPIKSFDISGNKIRGLVPPKLCLKDGVNGNGNDGDYNCDHIACPAYTYNPIGRKIAASGYGCFPCQHTADPIIGQKQCREFGVGAGVFGTIVLFVTLMICVSVCYISMSKQAEYKKFMSETDDEDSNEIELGNKVVRTCVSDGTVNSTDSGTRNRSHEQEPMVKGGRRDSQNSQNVSMTKNIRNESILLPYPDAVVSKNYKLNKTKSSRSGGSVSGSVVSIASNKSGRSGKFSIGSGDSGNKGDVWLDVPNIS